MAQADDVLQAGGAVGRAPGRRRRLRVPMAMALVGGIVVLVAVPVGSVLTISFLGARANTFALLEDRANLALELLESQVRTSLDPVEEAGRSLAELVESGALDVSDRASLVTGLKSALASLQPATAAIYMPQDGQPIRVMRSASGQPVEYTGVDGTEQAQERVLSVVKQADGPVWLPPIWVPVKQQPVLTLAAPIRRTGSFSGAIILPIALGDLGLSLARLDVEDATSAFILYGGTHVLAHADLAATVEAVRPGGEIPLPTVQQLADRGIALLNRRDAPGVERWERAGYSGLMDDQTLLLTQPLFGYGAVPWQIGLWFDTDEVDAEINRLMWIGFLGLVILILAVIAGLTFGKHLTRQIRELTDAAERLRVLDLAGAGWVPDSRIRELSNAAETFNAMTAALRWFETYVPRALVPRLMRAGGDAAVRSRACELTVMFTDICGFSAMAEHMSADETAALLNAHFDLIAECVEAEGGTVDKFVGDGVMAFWGAPEPLADHAAAALRAAKRICEIMPERDIHDLRVRVGIHSGPVVVGNIGSRNRVNYTVVGDTVNLANRLEELGRDLMRDDERCIVLVSEETAKRAGDGFQLTPLGDHQIRGRTGAVAAYRLV